MIISKSQRTEIFKFLWAQFKNLIDLIERDGNSLQVRQDIEIMDDWLRRIKSITTAYTSMH